MFSQIQETVRRVQFINPKHSKNMHGTKVPKHMCWYKDVRPQRGTEGIRGSSAGSTLETLCKNASAAQCPYMSISFAVSQSRYKLYLKRAYLSV